MRLMRVGPPGLERPAVAVDGGCVDVPPGVGMGATPPTYLRPGDVVELGITGLGRQRQTVVAAT